MQEKHKQFEPKEVAIKVKEPRLSPEEKLYVKSYLATLSHAKAHKAVKPEILHPKNDNYFSKMDAVKYHINKAMVLRTEALELDADKVLDLLLQEATRLGAGSSPTARVQALTLLGKQLGMFEEKREKEAVTFNIMNYSGDLPETPKKEDLLENKEEEPLEIPGIELKVENFDV